MLKYLLSILRGWGEKWINFFFALAPDLDSNSEGSGMGLCALSWDKNSPLRALEGSDSDKEYWPDSEHDCERYYGNCGPRQSPEESADESDSCPSLISSPPSLASLDSDDSVFDVFVNHPDNWLEDRKHA